MAVWSIVLPIIGYIFASAWDGKSHPLVASSSVVPRYLESHSPAQDLMIEPHIAIYGLAPSAQTHACNIQKVPHIPYARARTAVPAGPARA